jgi:hypothetical protein
MQLRNYFSSLIKEKTELRMQITTEGMVSLTQGMKKDKVSRKALSAAYIAY